MCKTRSWVSVPFDILAVQSPLLSGCNIQVSAVQPGHLENQIPLEGRFEHDDLMYAVTCKAVTQAVRSWLCKMSPDCFTGLQEVRITAGKCPEKGTSVFSVSGWMLDIKELLREEKHGDFLGSLGTLGT